MTAQLEIGTQVKITETFKGNTWTKLGEVVEIGTGGNQGRIRVRWSKWVYPNGYERMDGKRTWMKATRLQLA